MSRYYEIPELTFEKVIKDIKSGKIKGVKLEYPMTIFGKRVPRVYDGENYVWLLKETKTGGLGLKVFAGNHVEKFYKILKETYGNHLTLIYEEDLGFMHAGL